MASIKAKRKILFYGDSNTYGYDPADPYKNRYPLESCWISILSGRLSGKWEILCDAMNGRRIPDLRYDRERLDRLVSRLDPGGLLAIMLGTNDILFSTKPDAGAAVQKLKALLSFLCSRKSSEDILVVGQTQHLASVKGEIEPCIPLYRTIEDCPIYLKFKTLVLYRADIHQAGGIA